MSVYSVYHGPPKQSLGQRVDLSSVPNQISVSNQFSIPFINSTNLPPPFFKNAGGGLAYDVVTKTPWYSDGITWHPITPVLPTGNVHSYSFIAGLANQTILPSVDTTLIGWSTAGPPAVYSTLVQWNLATGIYTATQSETLYISACISWAAGVSNLGNRSLRIEYQAAGSGIWQIAAESGKQGEPSTNVETPQTCDMNLLMSVGDQARVTVFHNAPVNLQIAGTNHTGLSGFRVGT